MGSRVRVGREAALVCGHMESVSNMAAAAGEGSAVQELHCEHKAKAAGEGRDQRPPTALPRPPTPGKTEPHPLFWARMFSHTESYGGDVGSSRPFVFCFQRRTVYNSV